MLLSYEWTVSICSPYGCKACLSVYGRSSLQVQHQVALGERKVVSSSLEEDVASFLSFFHVKIDLCHVPILVCWYSIIVMWQLAVDGVYCNFTCIALWLAAIEKRYLFFGNFDFCSNY